MRSLSLLIAGLALLAAAAPAAAAERRVPVGWLGVVADGPLGPADSGEWDRMVTSGVESVRTAVRWYELQPYGSEATDFSGLDATVAAAAQRGLAVLPVVQSTPGWAARRPGDTASPPRDPATFGRFLAALVARYGPQGSLWAERPRAAARPDPRLAGLERAEHHALLVRAAVREVLRAAAARCARGAARSRPGRDRRARRTSERELEGAALDLQGRRARPLRRRRAASVHAQGRPT